MSEGTQRRLAAIISADVVGYSRLMGEDAAGTLTALRQLRTELFAPTVEDHNGRIVKSMGDGWLIEFASVVDAVTCAIEVQEQLAEHEVVKLRIGVHLGDITHEDEDIYGDGVNIAARLQEIAEPGAIVISDMAWRSIDGKQSAAFADLGEQDLKNIAKPVTAYGWGMTAVAAVALPLPDKPSIAVLPFDNMSGDPEQEFFADGITEEIITELSRWQDFHVLARNATLVYKGKTVSPMEIGRELNARFLVEGSVRRSGQRVRVTAQLIDTRDGTHVWAERYDREIEEIFAVQDEITQTIAGTLGSQMVGVNMERALRRPPNSVDAYELYLKANHHFFKFTKVDNKEAVRLLEAAIVKDPNYARAYAMLATSYRGQAEMGWTDDPDEVLQKAVELARRGVALDDRDPHAQQALGVTETALGNHERGIAALRKSIEINPNRNFGHAQMALVLQAAGRSEEALAAMKKAIALSPQYPSWFGATHGAILFDLGRFEDAETILADTVASLPTFSIAQARLAAVQAAAGKLEAAKATVADIQNFNPEYTIGNLRKSWPGIYKEATSPFLDALRLAGLPE